MDCKIHFGLYCVVVLIIVCHATDAASNATQTGAAKPNATQTGAAKPNATQTGAAKPNATQTGTGGSVVTLAPTPTTTQPAPIKCLSGVCLGNCSTFNTTTCPSDTANGCMIVKKPDAKGVDTYTFSCPSTGCTPSGSTVYCCSKDNCNPLPKPKKSNATTMFGNLVSITIILMLANYV